MYYPSSENKGADQLRSYCEADLHLCFRLGRLLVLPGGGSIIWPQVQNVWCPLQVGHNGYEGDWNYGDTNSSHNQMGPEFLHSCRQRAVIKTESVGRS